MSGTLCSSSIFSQNKDCDVIGFVMKDISKLKSQKLSNSYQYNLLKRSNIQSKVKNSLNGYFDERVSDSIINIFANIDLTNYDKINCKNRHIKLFEKSEIENIKKKNIEREKINHTPRYLIYCVSPIVYYKNYAIVECSQFLTLTDNITTIYLLEEIKNSWGVKIILYSAIS